MAVHQQPGSSAGTSAIRSRVSVDARPHILEVQGLEVAYAGSVQALRGVTVEIPTGAVVAVLGNNGAGKSSLLRALSGTLSHHGGAIGGGSIELDGTSIVGLSPSDVVRKGLIQVPEGRRVFTDLTVEENLRAGGFASTRTARTRTQAHVYDMFPILSDRRRQRAGLLSGGEQQMLAMGRALMGEPRVLLLDEPSLGLAPLVVDQIGEVIREINRQGVSVLLVEQNAAMALRVADRAFVFEVGGVTMTGSAQDLQHSDEVRERYLGVCANDPAVDAEVHGASTRVLEPTPTSTTVPPADKLSVDAVTVRFGGIAALTDVSFEVEPGSTHALIGPNGAGKSTCLNVLSGVTAPTAGVVRYGGRDISRLPAHKIARSGIARTFQNLALSPRATVMENLLIARHRHMGSGFASALLGLRSVGKEEARHERAVTQVADLLRLTPLLSTPVGELPYGDRKRVEMARALCAEPSLLLLDEPVAGMNHNETIAMEQAVRDVREELAVSIVLVEHDMRFVMGLADHVTVLDFGRRIADGTPSEVQSHPDVLRAYLGDAEVEAS